MARSASCRRKNRLSSFSAAACTRPRISPKAKSSAAARSFICGRPWDCGHLSSAKSSAPRRGARSRPGARSGITMSSANRVIAVIPAFNEAKTIAAVVAGVRAHVADVIVVDDRSTDATAEEAKRAGAIVLRNAANLGYDGSLNAGFAEAARRGADVFLTFDADGEHDPADLPRLIAPIAADSADIVAGQCPRLASFAEKIFA